MAGEQALAVGICASGLQTQVGWTARIGSETMYHSAAAGKRPKMNVALLAPPGQGTYQRAIDVKGVQLPCIDIIAIKLLQDWPASGACDAQAFQAKRDASPQCLEYSLLGGPKLEKCRTAAGQRQCRQSSRFIGTEVSPGDVQCPGTRAQAFEIDARLDRPGDRNQGMIAAVRPVEIERWVRGAGKCGPTVLTIRQSDSMCVDTQIGGQHCTQRRPPVLTLIRQMPHMNLVIAQMLCYVGGYLCAR